MDEMIFGNIPIVTDDRISAVLDKCTNCGEALATITTSGDGDLMMLLAQCKQCNRVYVLDEMRLPSL